ncbi:Sucrase/ferredoxin-like-domain-containing protein [Endogone sp. FLAS-F59071]|nr:Sucrase/ferredoxin-like-domain-containing protein [Endogone sp. FLAS-F59071]|eukprot:RUS22183.1 Sucrase/ferredoxin-like-domain-containing protein [Endogone sp. FLAS-F59071]
MSNWLKSLGSAFSSRSTTPVEGELDHLPSSRSHSPIPYNMGQTTSKPLPPEASVPPPDLVDADPCISCPDPCDTHRSLPFYLKIDHDIPLEGTMKPYGRHVVIATDRIDWAEDISDEQGSLAAALLDPNPEQPRIVTTNSSLTNLISTRPHSHDVLLFPDNLLIGNVTARNAELFYDMFLTNPPVLQGEDGEEVTHVPEMPSDSPFVVRVNMYEHVIMICSHKKRDKRCGIVAPLLKDEFVRVLNDKNIVEGEGGAVVLMVSHIGGEFGLHVLLGWEEEEREIAFGFAGNIILYSAQGRRGVWYGRVKVCHIRAIIERSIEQGRVLRELYRGCMDGSFLRKEGRQEELAW